MTLSILVETDDYQGTKYSTRKNTTLCYVVLNNCVFINQNDSKSIKKYKDAGIRVCVLPEDPVDQIISMTLLQKFNSITEGRLKVTDCTLGLI